MNENNKEKIFVVIEYDNVQTEDDIFIVKSDSIDNVLDTYAKEHYTKSDYFREDIESRSISISFWRQFLTDEIFYFKDDKIITDLNEDQIEEQFKRNIEKYLEGNKQFLQELIDFYYDEDKILED